MTTEHPEEGARKWFFPDGYLPESNAEGDLKSHDALMLLNTGPEPARVQIDVHFEDRAPAKGLVSEVGAERVCCLHMNQPSELNGLRIPPLTRYALRVVSDHKVIAQFGRLDASQANLAYDCTMGYASE
jgi:hypothetical protein